MKQQGIGVFFLTVLVGAEVIQTHDHIKANLAVKRLTRSERLAQERMAELEASVLEEELQDQMAGPEAAWQEANKMCKSDGTEEGCRCVGQLCEPGQCTRRPLPNDKSKDESCRLSEEHMLDSGRVLYYLELQTNVLHLKAQKYSKDCDSWLYTHIGRLQNVCARRTQQMLYATQFIAKANEPEVMDQMTFNQRARMQESYAQSSVIMAGALGEAEDKALINKLIADAKASAVMQQHTMVTVKRMVATIKDLVGPDEAAKAAARAYIENGDIAAEPTEEELGTDGTATSVEDVADVDRVMTEAEIQEEKGREHQRLDSEVEELARAMTSGDAGAVRKGDGSALLEVGDDGMAAAKTIGWVLLIILAVLGAIFIIKETVAAIACWILMVLLGCTVYHIGFEHGRQAALAPAQAPQRAESAWPPAKDGLLEVEAGGLVSSSEAAAAQFPWGKLGACYVRWFVLPFVLIGRAVVWVYRKVTGKPTRKQVDASKQ